MATRRSGRMPKSAAMQSAAMKKMKLFWATVWSRNVVVPQTTAAVTSATTGNCRRAKPGVRKPSTIRTSSQSGPSGPSGYLP
jgi:hypothetical protein